MLPEGIHKPSSITSVPCLLTESRSFFIYTATESINENKEEEIECERNLSCETFSHPRPHFGLPVLRDQFSSAEWMVLNGFTTHK